MMGSTARGVLAALAWTALLQILAYVLIRIAGPRRLMLAWAGGAALRIAGLVVFAILIIPAYALPLAASLLWLAVLLFVSTLIESYLLNRMAS